MGQTVAPTQRTPMIVHHLTLAHNEQKVTGTELDLIAVVPVAW